MSTSYTMSIGYRSGYSGPTGEEAEEILRQFINELRKSPERITAEVLRLEPTRVSVEDAKQYEDRYRKDSDLTLREYPAEEKYNAPVRWTQSATGGGSERSIKEAYRRAVIRLCLEAMHAQRIELCFEVG